MRIEPTIINIKLGLNKGWKTNTLPQHILEFQTLLYIRILRLIGGISILYLLSCGYSYSYRVALLSPATNIYLLLLALFFSIIFWLYHIYITYYRWKHIIYLIKSGELDIKNSPITN